MLACFFDLTPITAGDFCGFGSRARGVKFLAGHGRSWKNVRSQSCHATVIGACSVNVRRHDGPPCCFCAGIRRRMRLAGDDSASG
jgi:hypothetical protein